MQENYTLLSSSHGLEASQSVTVGVKVIPTDWRLSRFQKRGVAVVKRKQNSLLIVFYSLP